MFRLTINTTNFSNLPEFETTTKEGNQTKQKLQTQKARRAQGHVRTEFLKNTRVNRAREHAWHV